MQTKKEFYLVEEVAEMLRLNKMTIYRYIKAGKIRVHKMGKEFRISQSDLNSFLNSAKTK